MTFHGFRLLGDALHCLGILGFIIIVVWKGNAAGVSLKSQQLYLLVFLLRYVDLVTTFYSWYNTFMKLYYILATVLIVYYLTSKEPAKSTYAPNQDTMNIWLLIISSAMFGMTIHLVGSGVVDIRGGSGQEFEVHLEHYSWMSFFWTYSVCLEPLAMLPQLYIFMKNRLINREIRYSIGLIALYRVSYIIFWVFRSKLTDTNGRHHILLYISGLVQTVLYADFFIYHWSVFLLWFLSKYSRLVGDSSSMVEDSGIETWALTARGDNTAFSDPEISITSEREETTED